MITKKIEQFVEYGVKFTDEECEKLGINHGDKFSIDIDGDGVILKKYKSLELDLSEFSRETLEFLIAESCEKDVPVSIVIEEIVDKFIKNNP